ncbi:helix-turn-helix domain-containing protein [Pseudonocardia sp. WMMC193]|uniref:helix-turn-helix domain-containing protein n=1 Tax=Pseudonocardia sp. WMMC193 TaxID=2911965 RepID=UPI001F1C95B4|nr:helix-turn-helix domain-containing protein [Pseudonocardia sp. WMMC193]MCF7552204.1 hypothetical protein [Pseudonocardia sp. WMMC193]
MTEVKSVGQLVGEVLARRRIERGHTQGDAAQHARWAGLTWSRDHVASLETGRRESLSVEELLLLSSAYDMKLADWFEGDGQVALTPEIAVSRADLRATLGRGRSLKIDGIIVDMSNVPDVDRTEQLVAHRLDAEAPVVQQAAQQLWGRSFAEERDRRLGDVGDPQRARTLRAGMTKRMTREIEPTVRELS